MGRRGKREESEEAGEVEEAGEAEAPRGYDPELDVLVKTFGAFTPDGGKTSLAICARRYDDGPVKVVIERRFAAGKKKGRSVKAGRLSVAEVAGLAEVDAFEAMLAWVESESEKGEKAEKGKAGKK